MHSSPHAPRLPRRAILTAALAAPLLSRPGGARAQDAGLADTARRARGLDQLHALVVLRDGETVLADLKLPTSRVAN